MADPVPAGAVTAVALRKESVDRNNLHCVEEVSGDTVALRKESVDRNTNFSLASLCDLPSLSARRAWIEMSIYGCWTAPNRSLSARRAWIEICIPNRRLKKDLLSLSARRAWIEICLMYHYYKEVLVALRKESVDRNMWWGVRKAVGSRRSPQGERG